MSSERENLLGELSGAVRRDQRATVAVNEAANHLLGINGTDGRCLDILAQHGSLSAGELAREAQLTTGGLTAVIDRLERAGYARRAADPGDRRRVLVEITDRARELSWELFGPLAAASGPLLERYTDEQLTMLAEFHRIAAGMQERHADWLRERTGAQPPQGPAREP
jgi:DNA-binding MarR family transcriptional regulator